MEGGAREQCFRQGLTMADGLGIPEDFSKWFTAWNLDTKRGFFKDELAGVKTLVDWFGIDLKGIVGPPKDKQR